MSRSSRKVLGIAVLSALSGAAVGYALGLLHAPERGEITRRRLLYQLNRQIEYLGTLLDRIGKQVPVDNEALRSQREMLDSVQREADSIKRDMDELMEELKHTRK